MSGSKTIVVGLDIGTTKIACLVGTKNEHGKIEIISMGKSESLGVSRGIVSNIEKTVQSIKSAVEEAQDRVDADLVIRIVNVGIAGQHIKSLQHRGIYTRSSTENEISQKDIDALIEDMYKLVMQPGEEIIHVLPQEYIVDNETGILDPIGMSGRRLEANFHIITGHINAAMNINKCVQKAGLEVKDIILEPIASADAVLNFEEKEAGVVLVDIGGGTTDVAIFHEGVIRHTAVIPFGGNVITDDIKEGCTILRRHAEALKVKFGSALASESLETEVVCIPGLRGRDAKEITLRNLASIIQARMEEIIEHVYYEIRNSGYEKKLIAGIVVTGGGAQLKHITQLFEFITGMTTRIGLPTEHLASTNTIDSIVSPMYSTGIGLVMKGFEGVETNRPVETTAGQVKTHSNKSRGSFFDTIITKSKSWFAEDDY
ncbi:MAG: cell division protein FtsA [Candidatus Fluviicola riflensis]|nr:MAG: cell division protein FtsA [Candidatus Fluviicola riflensis]OGS76721.1 MAG: cell division protein FtsA [Candidatus Fluviicola riflensis]OGS82924.1 MAG: cell division protein FtsA [Fluviicola sp. RIFCSPHIGHO2_01_FULL_43_53]OGS88451.1 MAG: cell division protein FtsA [Fluviicola sp. RIFCSPHIGHO2_12_FULL_43_24]